MSTQELDGRLSSEAVASAFSGAASVEGFNHLPAARLGTASTEGEQAVFLASNDPEASTQIAAVAAQLGFADIELGRLNQGGVPLHIVDGKPGGLIFQNLAKIG